MGDRLSSGALSAIQAERRFDTDKDAYYLDFYEGYVGKWRTDPITLLEIGVRNGGSLLLWREYFRNGFIYGIDLEPPCLEDPSIRCFRCDQGDKETLAAIADQIGPLDLVIDDGAHTGTLAAASFDVLFPRLKSGGLYSLEDWGTGYWSDWPEGRMPTLEKLPSGRNGRFPSHDAGMVGLIKQLIDECALTDRYHVRNGLKPPHAPAIKSLHLITGLMLIEKA